MSEDENRIERLIREAGETGVDVVRPETVPRQSFRIVGGVDSAQVVLKDTTNTVAKRVAVTTISPERYLAVPVRDVPADGYSVDENGYDMDTTKAKIEALLGPGSHLDGLVWAKALKVISAGGKILFAREGLPVELHGAQVFPVRIVEQ